MGVLLRYGKPTALLIYASEELQDKVVDDALIRHLRHHPVDSRGTLTACLGMGPDVLYGAI